MYPVPNYCLVIESLDVSKPVLFFSMSTQKVQDFAFNIYSFLMFS